MATLAPCLDTLRSEFNALNPDRDKSTDGWIGDAAHQENPTSDHNPDGDGIVHAIDVDETGPWPCDNMEAFVQYIIAECRKSSGKDRGRLKYVIYERRIWSASDGWKEQYYSGSNPHDKHVHFSCEYSSNYENDTSPWGLVEEFGDDMPSPKELWDYLLTDPYDTSEEPRKVSAGNWLRYVSSDADLKNVKNDVAAVSEKVDCLDAKMDELLERISAIG
jgi:hypothetical protein